MSQTSRQVDWMVAIFWLVALTFSAACMVALGWLIESVAT